MSESTQRAGRSGEWHVARVNRTALAVVVLATIVRLMLAMLVPLFPDETYYWEWSRHLAAGYFDHPPAIALLIRAGTTVFGHTPLGVRVGVILAGAIASWAMVTLAGRLAMSSLANHQDDTSLTNASIASAETRASLLVSLIPVALVGFVLATPDAPLLAAVALTLVALERAVSAPARSRDSLGWWAASGVALGLAFCSKYTAVLVPFAVLIALVARPTLRGRLTGPGPYVATAIALLVFAPTIAWNAQHDWVSFTFQINHGLGAARGSALTREANLFGGQLGLVTPIIAVMAAASVARALRRRADDARFLLAVVATTVIVFFAISAIRKPVEANWPAPALLAALPLLAAWKLGASARRWFVVGCALAAAGTLIIAVHSTFGLLHLPPRRDPISRAHGWNGLAASVQLARRSPALGGCAATWVAADRYQDASELAFHLPLRPRVFALNLGGRPNQYDLWPDLYSSAQPDDCALVVVDEGAGGASVVERMQAQSSEIIATSTLSWHGTPVARRAIWLVRGLPPERPHELLLSPAARAVMDTLVHTLASREVTLDSITRIFARGPAPHLVAATEDGPAVSNSDVRVAIAARVTRLRAMLGRAAVLAVYRDARYRECTFIRARTANDTELGYIYASEGCALPPGRNPRMHVEHISGAWYAYAAPGPGSSGARP